MMTKRSFYILRFLMVLLLAFFLSVAVGGVNAKAEGEDEWVHFQGKVVNVSNALNVRTGPGGSYDKYKDATGTILQLRPDEEVLILEESESDDGDLWYKVEFERDGTKHQGYAYGEYISKEGEPITPTPKPADPTATPKPSPTPIIETATKAPATPTPSLSDFVDEEKPTETKNSKSSILFVIFLVIAVAVVFFGLFIILSLVKQNKRKNRIRNARKVDRMKNSEQESGNGKRKPEIRRSEDDGASVREVRQSVYYTNSEDEDELYGIMPKETDDKRSLRAAVDRLQEHDIINHKIYGEGEVYDNSDVKLMEVRFGNDVRFLNKDSIVAKRLIEIIDDEDQASARRRNRRNRNKRNDY